MISVLTQRALKFGALQWVRARARWGLNRAPSILYFGYGANLSMSRFERYSMNVEPVGVGRVKDFTLAFTLPCEYLGKGFGSIHPKAGEEVWGYLYRIDASSLFLLDTMEWAVMGQYRRIQVPVTLEDGTVVSALAYQTRCPRWNLVPSVVYRDLLVKGAKENGFPPSYWERIAATPAQSSFPLDPTFSFIHPNRPRWGSSLFRRLYLAHDRVREKVCDLLRF